MQLKIKIRNMLTRILRDIDYRKLDFANPNQKKTFNAIKEDFIKSRSSNCIFFFNHKNFILMIKNLKLVSF
jgi:hypothetical protein